ncbi:polysaccharide biosynthesis tyrosine autokinase [Paraburkholderia sp. CNPSo 3157]|uniref:Polysaccharide biosynthesis tyrosine autokinase n=1 Tax=Paraburkholderia franconis TaxID=2654983 RepID=A0A7X1TFR2_9BURK|nr:polysaccharide biosynthesis tyrosine autokinase [Paraburkholderia franconis]MPW17414.1 polysaccharide biosynthesis tyrosine autokinase [Paraburkholderia franconis]
MSTLRGKVRGDSEEFIEVSVLSVLRSLRARWITVALTTALFILAACVYVVLATPVYRARILVQLEDTGDTSQPSMKGVMGEMSSMFTVKPIAEGESQLLGSTFVLSRVVEVLSLNVSAAPHYFPVIGRVIARNTEGHSRPGIFGKGGYAWGDESIDVTRFDVPRRYEGHTYSLIVLQNGQFRLSGNGLADPVTGHVGIENIFSTPYGPIVLTIKKIVGEEGVYFDLVDRSRLQTADALRHDLQITEQGNKSGVLAATLEGANPALLSATLNEIAKQYTEQNAERRAVHAESALEFLESQLPAMKRRVEQAEEKYTTYRNRQSIVDVDEEGKLLLKQSAAAETTLLELQQKRQEMAAHYTPNHPAVSLVDRQMEVVRKGIADLDQKIRSVPEREQGTLALMREVRVSTSLYAGMLENMAELRLLKSSKMGSVRLVDEAQIPEIPVKPKRSVILLGSAVLGLFFGAGAALLRSKLHDGVTDVRLLEQDTGFAVCGVVPFSARMRALAREQCPQPLLAARHPQDPAVESLRILRTRLLATMTRARNNVVLVTGPLPGIGKSFVSANLAAILAAGGQRVLLVDGDMRRGHLHDYFGVSPCGGLSEILEGCMPASATIHRGVQNNLDFLAAGARPSNAPELLMSSLWKDMIEAMKLRYDVILLDAPAVLPVSDAEIMAADAGSVFVVARFAETRADEMIESLRALRQANAAVKGIVLNGIISTGHYPYRRIYGSYISYGFEAGNRSLGENQRSKSAKI